MCGLQYLRKGDERAVHVVVADVSLPMFAASECFIAQFAAFYVGNEWMRGHVYWR